ncbi:unnamed protein product [Ectocarpus fasciculatus]
MRRVRCQLLTVSKHHETGIDNKKKKKSRPHVWHPPLAIEMRFDFRKPSHFEKCFCFPSHVYAPHLPEERFCSVHKKKKTHTHTLKSIKSRQTHVHSRHARGPTAAPNIMLEPSLSGKRTGTEK